MATLQILHLEDSRLDARAVESHVKAAFPDSWIDWVGSRIAFEKALRERDYEIILCDYVVPDVAGTQAIRLAKQSQPTTPIIVVTGAIGDEAAAETVRAGASDFVLKSNLARLANAMRQVLDEAREARILIRGASPQAEYLQAHRPILTPLHLVARFDSEARFLFANQAWQEALGVSDGGLVAQPLLETPMRADTRSGLFNLVHQALQEGRTLTALLPAPGGGDAQVEFRIIPETLADPTLPSVLTLGGDPTQTALGKEHQRFQEATFRAAFKDGLMLAWLLDPATETILEANQSAALFYNYPLDAFEGMPLRHLCTLDPTARRIHMTRLLNGEALHFEVQHRKSCGVVRDMEMFYSPLSSLGRPLALAVAHDITLRKAAERRLLNAQRWGHMGDWVLELATQRISVSENLCRLLGLAPEAFPTELAEALMLIHPEDRARFEGEIEALAKGRNETFRGVFRVLRSDGAFRHHQIFGELHRDVTQGPLMLQGTSLDISELITTETDRDHHFKQLQNLRLALDQAAIWALTDAKGIITYANDKFCEVSGYSRDDLMGQNHRMLKSGMHPPGFFRDMWHTIRGGNIWKGVICNRKKDGQLYWVDATIVPFLGVDGKPQEYLAIRFEITRQVLAERAQARLAEERDALLEASSVAKAVPFTEAPDGSLLVGPNAQEVLGVASAGPRFSMAELKGPLKWDVQDTFLSLASLEDDAPPRTFTAPFAKGGDTLWTRWTMARKKGRLRGVIQDITEAHLLEDELRQSQKLESLGTLVGGIAHDFNNLLMAILGYVDVLRETEQSPQGMASALNTIHRAASRGQSLVSELMNFSRRQPPSRMPTDLNQVLVEVANLVARALPTRIQVEVQPATGLPDVPADPSQLHQVVMNLALNARDALSGSGLITLRTGRTCVDAAEAQAHGKAPGNYAVLEVEDSGPGMAPEVAARIFEPFFTTKPVGKGTGLGLSVVHGIVRSHGGFLRLRTEPGFGTCISVLLPEVAAAAASSEGEAMPADWIALLGPPSPDREALATLVSGLGHPTRTFDTIEVLLEAARLSQPALILTHPGSREENVRFLDRLQNAPDLPQPILLLTSDPITPRALPFQTIPLSNPIKTTELLDVLDRFLPRGPHEAHPVD